MKLSRFFELVRRYGVAADPRGGKKNIAGYADSAILNGSMEADVRKILVGIDIDTPELLLADRIRRQSGLDLVLAHHPQGKALAGLYGVMQLQVDILRSAGIPEQVAQGYLNDRKRQVMRRLSSGNHNRAVDAARLLNIPMVCAHTPADNHVFQFI
ncbi:MAG: NGG1p interacting factor NIF3, partial [Candidatus Omnitrophota bacterium]